MTKQDARYLAQTAARLAKAAGDNVGRPVEDALALHLIAGSLHRYAERECSVEMGERETARVGKRVENLEAKASAIATAYGFRAYFQGDCRGCPLYLIAEVDIPDSERLADIHAGGKGWTMVSRWIESNYSSRGHAVPWLG